MKNAILAGLLTLLSGSWLAANWAQAVAAPAVQEYQGVRYVTGGIGDDERNQMLAGAKDFNLKLEFAEKGGAYLSDIGVVVADTGGKKVLELRSDGPLVLAKLPPGSYRIAVTSGGREQTRTANVSATGQQALAFYW